MERKFKHGDRLVCVLECSAQPYLKLGAEYLVDGYLIDELPESSGDLVTLVGHFVAYPEHCFQLKGE
jgi:hypothetical protein